MLNRTPRTPGSYGLRIAALVFATVLQTATPAAPGDVDVTFGNGGVSLAGFAEEAISRARAIVRLQDGKWLAGGECIPQAGLSPLGCMARFDVNGALDTGFGDGGRVVGGVAGHLPRIYELVLDGNQRPWAFGAGCLVRLLASGDIDPAFDITTTCNGSANAGLSDGRTVVIRPDGSFLLGGGCFGSGFPTFEPNALCVVRRLADGSIDTAFGTGGVASVTFGPLSAATEAIIVQSDGKLVALGTCVSAPNVPVTSSQMCGARFTAAGQLDSSFATAGTFSLHASPGLESTGIDAALALADGRLVALGRCGGAYGCALRLSSDGVLDASYGAAGTLSFDVLTSGVHPVRAGQRVIAQRDDRVLFTAPCATGVCVVRLRSDGVPDGGFGIGGYAPISSFHNQDSRFRPRTGIAFAANGDIVVGGACLFPPPVTATYSDLCIGKLKRGPYDAALCALNVDGSAAVDIREDGLLILRYLLGVRGEPLTRDVMGITAGRAPAQTEAYLQALSVATVGSGEKRLDIDGDGEISAMTDGLLILRAMLGLTGDALTAGAVNTSHPNARDAQQILNWIETTHGVACLP